ncbi:MAG: glycoside hydrolase family 3 N-terminal domain-containing protein, partial [Mycobacterium sp.]
MLNRVLPLRAVAALAALPVVLASCSSTAPRTQSAPDTVTGAAESATVTPMSGPIQVPAAPAPPACGDGAAMLAAMSTRDKLAQLLMVGVKNAADARAVVGSSHVGGIMIGSWTDLSMLSDGTIAEISNMGPLPLAVSVDEEGGRVSRLASMIGASPSARTLAATQTPDKVYQLALARGRQMRGLGITIDFAPVVDVSDQGANTVIGDRSFSSDPATVTT